MTARLLAIMGSGETSPTMGKVHRDLLARVTGPAVFLDAPAGFQENVAELAERAVAYFAETVGAPLEVASYRAESEVGTVPYERALATVAGAGYVFAGPGSPSYALRTLGASRIPDLLRHKLREGGCVVFASAAACTLGEVGLPVYEIYKVGEPPRWLPGLDLLIETGVRAAVVPHWDNAEGGTHDTRYCYMGETRLRALEEQLPDDVIVLGVEEHTACIIDLEAATATVAGRGALVVRDHGEERRHETGSTVAVDALVGRGSRGAGRRVDPGAGEAPSGDVNALFQRFEGGLDERDANAALAAAFAVDDLAAGGDAAARGALRSMLVRLADVAESGLADPRDAAAPFVDALVELRERARAERRWTDADAIRDALEGAGIEVRDGAGATAWVLHEG